MLDKFFDKEYSTRVDEETRRRIRLSVFAYAYEYDSNPIVSDGEFDELCLQIDTTIDTRRPELDEYFRKEFDPSTGMWIRNHPELDKIRFIYERYYKR